MKYKSVLRYFDNTKVTACIAGGYVRDKLLDLCDPKDVDIFVLNADYSSVYRGISSINSRDIKFVPNYPGMEFRDDVNFLVKYKDVDVLSMSNSGLQDMVRNFDVSVCQCYGVYDRILDDIVYYVSGDFLDFYRQGVVYQYIDVPTTDDHLDRVSKKVGVPREKWIKKESGNVTMFPWGTRTYKRIAI